MTPPARSRHGRPGPRAILALASLLVFAGGGAAASLPAPGPAGATAAEVLASVTRLTAAAGLARLGAVPVAPAGEAAKAAARPAEVAAGVVVVCLAEPLPEGPFGKGGATGFAALGRLQAAGAAPVAWAPWRPAPTRRNGSGAAGGAADRLARAAVVFYAGAAAAQEAAAAWAALPGVEFAEPYHLHRTTRSPDDPLFSEQAHLEVVAAPLAWDTARGQDAPVPVAVVDEGFAIAHRDLQANLLLNAADPPGGGDEDGNGYPDDHRGWNFARGNDDPSDMPPASLPHGTHVAGLVGAVTDNGLDVAGLAWNSPLLCVAAGDPAEPTRIRYGYQGILYAAERGARVINCSWGRSGNPSLLEQAVVAEAVARGAMIVAAAGNDALSTPFYPAAYEEVVAVANVFASGAPHFSSNRGPWVDVAAPGVDLLSLSPGDLTARLTGTSMASPVAAGCAALLLGRRPGLGPAAAHVALRLACRELPGGWTVNLGAGMVDAAAAVSRQGPAYLLVEAGLEDDGDGCLEPGEEAVLRPRWRNLLDDGAAPVLVRLLADPIQVEVLQSEAVLAPLPSGGSAAAEPPFRVRLRSYLPVGSRLALTFELSAADAEGPEAGYRDRQALEFPVLPLTTDLAGSALRLSLAGNGRLGFAGIGGGDGSDGRGVRWVPDLGGPDDARANLLFEGAVLAGVGPQRISDAARREAGGAFDRDLVPAGTSGLPRPLPRVRLQDGRLLDGATSTLTDEGATWPLGLEIGWEAFVPAPGGPALACVLATFRNRSGAAIAGLRVGFFLDWDLGDGTYWPDLRANGTELAADGATAAVWREAAPEGMTVATALEAPGAPVRFRAVANDGSAGPWGIYDGFSDQEKWEALSAEGPAAMRQTDVSQVWAAGPFDLAAQDSLRVVLVLAAGPDPAGAEAAVREGRAAAAALLAEQRWDPPVLPLMIGRPAPNPANAAISVAVAGDPDQPWRLRVHDLRGRAVRDLLLRLPAAEGTLVWDGRDARGRWAPAGVYLLRIGQAGRTELRKATLAR